MQRFATETTTKLLEGGISLRETSKANIGSIVAQLTEPSDKASSEFDFRYLVSELYEKVNEDNGPFYPAVAKQDYKTITTAALKVLVLTHKS